jgi:hypothetical protein
MENDSASLHRLIIQKRPLIAGRHKEVMGLTENRLNIISCHGTFTQKTDELSLFRILIFCLTNIYKQASNSWNSILKLMRSKTKIPRIPITLVTSRNKSQQTLVFCTSWNEKNEFQFRNWTLPLLKSTEPEKNISWTFFRKIKCLIASSPLLNDPPLQTQLFLTYRLGPWLRKI